MSLERGFVFEIELRRNCWLVIAGGPRKHNGVSVHIDSGVIGDVRHGRNRRSVRGWAMLLNHDAAKFPVRLQIQGGGSNSKSLPKMPAGEMPPFTTLGMHVF